MALLHIGKLVDDLLCTWIQAFMYGNVCICPLAACRKARSRVVYIGSGICGYTNDVCHVFHIFTTFVTYRLHAQVV